MGNSDQRLLIDFYWRPGCPFCIDLERQLRALDVPLNKHNIWESETAADAVRSIAEGDETVPTVVVGDVGMVNPTAAQVMEAVESQYPPQSPSGSLH